MQVPKLSTILVLGSATLTLLLTLVIVALGSSSVQEIKHEMGNGMKELAYQTTDKLDYGIWERYREIALLAGRSELANSRVPLQAKRELFDTIRQTRPFYAWIGATDLDGKVLFATKRVLEGVDVSHSPWYANALNGVSLTDVHEAAPLASLLPNPSKESMRFLDIAFPYRDAKGKTTGVVAVHLNWQWARTVEKAVLKSISQSKKITVLILDKNGIVLLGPEQLIDQKLELPSLAAAGRRQNGYVEEMWPDGKRYLVGFNKSAGYQDYLGLGWIVLVRQEAAGAYAPAISLQQEIIAGGVVAALLISLLGLVSANLLARSLRRMARFAADIDSGGTAASYSPAGFRDLRTLGTTLENLLKKLAANEERLRESNLRLEEKILERTVELHAAAAQAKASQRRFHGIIDTAIEAFVALDYKANIVEWNLQAERLFGWSCAEVIGQPVTSRLFQGSDRERFEEMFTSLVRARSDASPGQRLAMVALRRDNAILPVEVSIGRIDTMDEQFFGMFVQDVSVRKQIEEELAKEREVLRTVLDTIDVGVVACNENGELTIFNPAAQAFHGLVTESISPAEWSNHYELFSADGSRQLRTDEVPLYRALLGETVRNVEMVIARKDGSKRSLLASGRPMFNASGKGIGAVVGMKDISLFKESERQVAVNEARLRAITESIPALIGQIGKDQRFVFLNTRGAKLFGKAPAELIGVAVQDAYDPAQYASVKPYVEEVLAGKKAVFEHAITRGPSTRHYQAIYVPYFAADGSVGGFYAMAFDITDRKLSEMRQAQSEKMLRTVTDNLPILIAYIDCEERYVFSNKTFQAWFGIPVHEMLGKTVREVIGEEVYAQARPYLEQCFAGTPVCFETVRMIKGRELVAQSIGIPDFKDDKVQGIYAMITDVTAAKDHERKLAVLAHEDTLTGLPNRRSFEERMANALARAGRSGTAVGLMVLDVDYFKAINDTLGHAGGDSVLKQFAQRLSGAVRVTDTVARLAGDEFTIILEDLNTIADAVAVAEKVLTAVRCQFVVNGDLLAVSTSIGISFTQAPLIGADELMKKADDALYAAKAAGRDGYRLYVQALGDA